MPRGGGGGGGWRGFMFLRLLCPRSVECKTMSFVFVLHACEVELSQVIQVSVVASLVVGVTSNEGYVLLPFVC